MATPKTTTLVVKNEDAQLVYGAAYTPSLTAGYWVSSDGRVWSTRPLNGRGSLLPWEQRRELKPIVQDNGYLTVCLDRKFIAIHVLVLKTFVGPCPPGKQCRHRDGDKTNNRLDNLVWGTCVEQADDREKHGTKLKGSQVGTAKLTEIQVLEARSMRPTFTLVHIAKKMGVSKSAIFHAVSKTGSNWRHL